MIDLPEISFADTSTKNVERAVITTYEGLTGATLYPGDPVRLFLQSLAALIVQQRTIIDFTGKQNLLRYAVGDYLDHLGAMTETQRLAESKAITTVRFSMDAPLGFVVAIAAGTRITPDRKLYFATTGYGEIPAGETYTDVAAECQTPGSAGNGLVPGQINRLVDPIAYISSVANISVTTGGADAESDDSFRERIHVSPEKYSVAGPDGAYFYWAQSAHQDIIDVAVYSAVPGEVTVCPLLSGGAVPGQDILDAVATVLSDEKTRPLTDTVTVVAPVPVPYDLTLSYYVVSSNVEILPQIQAAVQMAVTDFVNWQKTKLGRDINPDELNRRVTNAGAKRVDINFNFSTLEVWQIAQEGTVSVTYGGLEDE